jgi:hypothetical protein
MGALMRADAELLAPPNTILLSGLALLSSFLWYKPGLIYTPVYIHIYYELGRVVEGACVLNRTGGALLQACEILVEARQLARAGGDRPGRSAHGSPVGARLYRP